jgi:hypothetical protein
MSIFGRISPTNYGDSEAHIMKYVVCIHKQLIKAIEAKANFALTEVMTVHQYSRVHLGMFVLPLGEDRDDR